MTRTVRLALLLVLFALAMPAAASAGPRMWMGFQDDPYFRWLPERFSCATAPCRRTRR